jgi:hypothetical protein
MSAALSSALRLIHPAPYAELDAAAQADQDVADVLEAAATLHLDEVDLTDYQQLNMTRLFPRTDSSNGAWWRQHITDRLALVAEDLRRWWEADNGVEVDGRPVPVWEAESSRVQAEMLARRLLAGATS